MSLATQRLSRRDLFVRGAQIGVGLAAAGPIASLLEACGGAPASTSVDSLTYYKTHAIRLAYIVAPPQVYIDDKTGKVTGFGPDLIAAVLKNLGLKPFESVVAEWTAYIPGLLAKRWDISAIPFFVTPERCSKVGFTNPVTINGEGAVVRSGNPVGIHSWTDLKGSVKPAVVPGTAEQDWAKQLSIPNMVLFPDAPSAFAGIRAGRADAFLDSSFNLHSDLTHYGGDGLELVKPFKGPIINGQEQIGYSGYAVRYEDITFLNAFNDEIAKMNQSGELQSIFGPYGYTPDLLAPPLNLTAKDLCPAGKWPADYKDPYPAPYKPTA